MNEKSENQLDKSSHIPQKHLQVVGYYTPEKYKKADFDEYTTQKNSAEKQLSANEKLKKSLQEEAKAIRDTFLKEFERSPYKNTPIYVFGGAYPYPLKFLLVSLEKIKEDALTPSLILKEIDDCVGRFKLNDLPYDFSILLKMENQHIIDKAHEAGTELEKKFADYKPNLTELTKKWDELENNQKQIENNLKSYLPSTKTNKILLDSFNHALDKITDEAQRIGANCIGITGVCSDLKRNHSKSIDEIVNEYSTLKNMNSQQSEKIKLLKEIQKAHLENWIVGQKYSNKQILEAFQEQKENSSYSQRDASEEGAAINNDKKEMPVNSKDEEIEDIVQSGNIIGSGSAHSEPDSSSKMNISMMVLGGFIAALGIAAVAVAFTVLNAATLGVPGLVVAGIGMAAVLSGIGLFAVGTYKNRTTSPPEELADDSVVQPRFNT